MIMNPIYKTLINNKLGKQIEVTLTPVESELDFKNKHIKDVRAYCFCGDKLVLVWSKDHWNTPGGSIEKGESPREAVTREVREETNMEVVKQCFIFLQSYSFVENLDIALEPSYQTVSVCRVEQEEVFESDPDGDISKIELIDPQDYKQYLDWGERGEILMRRAIEINQKLDLGTNHFS